MAGHHRNLAVSLSAAVLCLFHTIQAVEARGWSDYQIIIWQKQSASGYRMLQSIGVTAGAVLADRDRPQRLNTEDVRRLTDNGLGYYVENIATDFYSAYHRFFPDRPVNWRFREVKQLYLTDPGNPAALVRDPSLSDPAWLEKVTQRVRDTVETNRPYGPLFYNLADEPGIADLNAFWDFDLSEPSLGAMRQWLMSRYASLAALNAEWGTQFLKWDAVTPMTTPQAMRRDDRNFAAWVDFKEWMDVAFARALEAGRRAVHTADPGALAGMEGGQQLGWGGYDYTKLAGAVDVMETEPELFPLVRALNPSLRLISTSFQSGPVEEHRIWRALLAGGSGIILWDSKREFVTPEGSLGQRGRLAESYFTELRRGVAALVMNSEPEPATVAILYSPESLRVQWLLDWRDRGDAWLERGAGAEARDDNTVRAAIATSARTLEQLGFTPTYLSSAGVETGALRRGIRVLMLPHVIALSDAAAQAIVDFAAAGGVVIADTLPGIYDEHGKRRPITPLAALFREGRALEISLAKARRELGVDPPLRIAAHNRARLAAALAPREIAPTIRIDEKGSAVPDVSVRTFRNGDVTLLSVLRDMPAAGTERVAVHLPAAAYVYDVRQGAQLGFQSALNLALGGPGPALLALSPHPMPPPTLAIVPSADAGDRIPLRIGLSEPTAAKMHVLHVMAYDPLGRASTEHSANILLHGSEAETSVTFAPNAASGPWKIRVVDVMSGQAAEAMVSIRQP